MRKPPSASSIAVISAICLMSTIGPAHRAGAHLHQQIGAAGQDARGTSGGGKGADRFVERVWAHYRISVMGLCRLPVCSAAGDCGHLCLARERASLHGPKRLEQPPQTGSNGRLLCDGRACVGPSRAHGMAGRATSNSGCRKQPENGLHFVMAGLDPAIHVLLACSDKDVDARHKAGHDVLCRMMLRHAHLLRIGFPSGTA